MVGVQNYLKLVIFLRPVVKPDVWILKKKKQHLEILVFSYVLMKRKRYVLRGLITLCQKSLFWGREFHNCKH